MDFLASMHTDDEDQCFCVSIPVTKTLSKNAISLRSNKFQRYISRIVGNYLHSSGQSEPRQFVSASDRGTSTWLSGSTIYWSGETSLSFSPDRHTVAIADHWRDAHNKKLAVIYVKVSQPTSPSFLSLSRTTYAD